MKDFDIRTPSIHTLAGSLSGGNQQKVVVAREFSVPVQLVIAAQPTRGLDVGSIEYIHRRLIEQRDAGAAILIVSTELDEVLAVGDRIAVMFEGRIVGILSGATTRRTRTSACSWAARRSAGASPHDAGSGSLLRKALVPLLAVITAFLFGAVVIVLTDFVEPGPARDRSGRGHRRRRRRRARGATARCCPGRSATRPASWPRSRAATSATSRPPIRPITETLVAATPLIFTGLAVAISFRAGMFNIGVDGQLMIGALGATITAIALAGQVPAFAILIAAIVMGVHVRRLLGVHPRLPQGADGSARGHHDDHAELHRRAGRLLRPALDDAARPGKHRAGVEEPDADRRTCRRSSPWPAIRLDFGFVIALLVGVAVSWLLFRTTLGFELRASGFNMTAARYAGMSAGGSMMLAMALSGALAGMAGSFMVVGTVGQLSLDLSGGIGFTAIALALLAEPAAERRDPRGAAVRSTDDGRQGDGHPVGDPVRPPVVHHGARHHVRRGARPDPVDLAGARRQARA